MATAESFQSQKQLINFQRTDAYIDNKFLMGSLWAPLVITASYLLFVLKIGPAYMKNRQPYKLKSIILVYNIFQVVYSLYLFKKGFQMIWERGLVETKCLLHIEEFKHQVVDAHYLYFLAKLTELLDTIFFVLRKKTNQVTFLHVYHHSIMFSMTWVGLKYEVNYSVAFLGTINSLVHVIMYSYYLLSSYPRLEKYLWWKKYITKIQLIQFFMVLVNITANSIIGECPFSYFLLTLCWAHGILFIYLFTDFYYKSYKKKRDNAKIIIDAHSSKLKGGELFKKESSGVSIKRLVGERT